MNTYTALHFSFERSTPDILEAFIGQLIESIKRVNSRMLSVILPLHDDDADQCIDASPFCAITMETAIRPVVTPCRHVFDADAMTTWLQTSQTCPLCRTKCSQASLSRGDTVGREFDKKASQSDLTSLLQFCIQHSDYLHRHPLRFSVLLDKLSKLSKFNQRIFKLMFRLDAALVPMRPSLKGPYLHIRENGGMAMVIWL